MAKKKYTVDLTEDERAELESFVSHGKRSAQAVTRARCLLRADEGLSDPDIAEVLDCHLMTVQRARKRYYKEDWIAATYRLVSCVTERLEIEIGRNRAGYKRVVWLHVVNYRSLGRLIAPRRDRLVGQRFRRPIRRSSTLPYCQTS